MGGHRPKAISGKHRDWLLERAKTDFTLRGLVAELAERGLKVDSSVEPLGVRSRRRSKLQKSVVASERDRPDIARRRVDNGRSMRARSAPDPLVLIDETWTKTNMATLRGWAPCGTRLAAEIVRMATGRPRPSWPTLRYDLIEAPPVLNGPIVFGESFTVLRREVSSSRGPEARRHRHHGQSRQPLARVNSWRLHLSARWAQNSSFCRNTAPDLNPIDAGLRRSLSRPAAVAKPSAARTVEAVWAAIGQHFKKAFMTRGMSGQDRYWQKRGIRINPADSSRSSAF